MIRLMGDGIKLKYKTIYQDFVCLYCRLSSVPNFKLLIRLSSYTNPKKEIFIFEIVMKSGRTLSWLINQ